MTIRQVLLDIEGLAADADPKTFMVALARAEFRELAREGKLTCRECGEKVVFGDGSNIDVNTAIIVDDKCYCPDCAELLPDPPIAECRFCDSRIFLDPKTEGDDWHSVLVYDGPFDDGKPERVYYHASCQSYFDDSYHYCDDCNRTVHVSTYGERGMMVQLDGSEICRRCWDKKLLEDGAPVDRILERDWDDLFPFGDMVETVKQAGFVKLLEGFGDDGKFRKQVKGLLGVTDDKAQMQLLIRRDYGSMFEVWGRVVPA